MAACRPAITSNTEIAGPVRRAVRVAGQAHQAGHGLDHEVVAGQCRAPAPLPKPLIEA